METNRAYQRVVADVVRAKRSGRRAGLVALGLAVLIVAGAMFSFAERTDDLQVVLYGLGGLVGTLGAAFVLRSFLPTDSHPLVSLLRDRIGDISRIAFFKVIRNNAFVAIRLEIEQSGGPKLVYQEPKARGEAWLEAIYRERPDLR